MRIVEEGRRLAFLISGLMSTSVLGAGVLGAMMFVQPALAQPRPPVDIPHKTDIQSLASPSHNPITAARPRTTDKPRTAADAVNAMASAFGVVSIGLSSAEMLAALEAAAEAGEATALWRLGVMYENGEGVKQDQVRAFGYFARIANEHADTPPKSLEADVVAQSFVKVGEYYKSGLPDAGITVDNRRTTALWLHAASYFGDADAQYRVGDRYLNDDDMGNSPLQGARWLQLAATKGHVLAQAKLGDLLFQGREGITPQPQEGLIWLNIATIGALGTQDEAIVTELLSRAMSIATPEERTHAIQAASAYRGPIGY